MNKKVFIFLSLLLFAVTTGTKTNAQGASPAEIPWKFVAEIPKMIDIWYKIMPCNGRNELHLRVFNESRWAQDVAFNVEISAPGMDKKLLLDVKVSTQSAKEYKAECGEENESNPLKFEIPSAYNPASLVVKIIRKEETN